MGSKEDVQAWNQRVRVLADELWDNSVFGFSCQCGCGTVVALTSKSFDATGAWADGHNPDLLLGTEVKEMDGTGSAEHAGGDASGGLETDSRTAT